MNLTNATPRHALTLIEVLAATVLLALVAGACASMLRTAALAHTADSEPVRLDELSALADDLLAPSADSPASDSVHRWLDTSDRALELPWPDRPDLPPVSLFRLTSTESRAEHAWIELCTADTRVWRWVRVEAFSQEPAE